MKNVLRWLFLLLIFNVLAASCNGAKIISSGLKQNPSIRIINHTALSSAAGINSP